MRVFLGTLLSQPNRDHYDRCAVDVIGTDRRVRRPIPRSSAHLTHVFCGDVSADELERLLVAVRQTVARCHVFPITIGPPHVLWARAAPRLVSAEITKGGDELRRLSASLTREIGAACPRLDLRHRQAPHVTLVRFGRGARRSDGEETERRLARLVGSSTERADRIGHVAVIESTLTTAQPEYRVIAELALPAEGVEGPT